MSKAIKYFSMFTGIGGFELGIQRASDKQFATIKQDGQGWNGNADKVEHNVLPTSRVAPLCIGYSEIDKYAINTYERQFNGHTNYGDATAINAAELPDFDLIVGGFPCQSFSIAGKRKGFDDTRGTLFFDIARILAEKRPRHLVLENVKGLLSHNGGETFTVILGVLSDLGYRVEWQVLNSKDFGVPQNRERVYFIGHLRGECSGQVLPITGTNGKAIVQLNNPTHSNDRVYASDGISPTLNTMQGGNRQPFIAAQRGRYDDDGKIVQKLEPRFDGVSNTLTAVQKDNMWYSPKIRRLTPVECERLQGFPDNWTEGESDSQRYKMCGNAVTVNVVETVMTSLLNRGCL